MEQKSLEEQKEKMYSELFDRNEGRVITEKDVEDMRECIGIEIPLTDAFNEECTRDSLCKLILGIGDGNPLYWDEEYARKTRWDGLIAHPSYIQTTGTSVKSELLREEASKKGFDAMSNIQCLDGGIDLYFYRPIRIGDFIWSRKYLLEVKKKKSEFAGKSIITNCRQLWANDKGELLAAGTRTMVLVGREKTPGERTKYSHIKDRIHYTPDDIVRIDKEIDREEVRGAEPRYWEDVNEGDELAPVVKGPILYVDVFNFIVGHGMAIYDGSHRWGYEHRKKNPGAWLVNSFGVPDTMESVHYTDGGATTKVGMPTEYIYGDMIFSWLVHLTTNWMGDDAWLYHLDTRYKEPVFIYDTNWIQGKVTSKYVDNAGQYKVNIDIHSEDNRGRIPFTGHATVILPSKTGGLPKVSPLDTPAPFKPGEAKVPTREKP